MSIKVKVTGYSTPSKIPPIKGVRLVTGMGLREAKFIIDDAERGLPTQIEVDSLSSVAILRECGVEFEVDPGTTHDVVYQALQAMPPHLTVGDVVWVLKAVR